MSCDILRLFKKKKTIQENTKLFKKYFKSENIKKIIKLLKEKNKPKITKNEIFFLLKMAFDHRNNNLFDILLTIKNLDVNYKVGKRNNIIYYAVNTLQPKLNMIEKLLKKGADINNNYTNVQKTLLMFPNVTLPVAELLIKYRIKINGVDKNKKTVIMYAIEENNLNLVKLLLKHNAKVDIETLELAELLKLKGKNTTKIINLLKKKINQK